MKKIIISAMVIFTFASVFGQDEEKKPEGWIPTGVVGLNISQVSVSNWTQGGENSLAWSLIGNFGAQYIAEPWKFTSSLKAAWGRLQSGEDPIKTIDNEFFWDQILTYKLGWVVSPYFSNTIRTVVADGYNYEKKPWVHIASFWDPGYINQGLGFTYDPSEAYELRFGIGFKETWADFFAGKYTDDSTTTNLEKFKFETGIDFAGTGKWNLHKNILFTTKFNLFGRFEDLAIWDVRWDNSITAKITDIINVNFNVLLVYDEDQSMKRQIKQALQLGISYTIF